MARTRAGTGTMRRTSASPTTLGRSFTIHVLGMVEQEKSLHASHLDRGSVARRMTLTTEEPAIELTIPPKKEGEQDRLRVKALSPRGFWGRRTLDCKWRWWGPGTSWSFQSNEQIALAWFEWQESPDAGSRAIEPTFNSFDTLTLRSTAAGAESASLVTDAALAMADAQHHGCRTHSTARVEAMATVSRTSTCALMQLGFRTRQSRRWRLDGGSTVRRTFTTPQH